MEFRYPNTPPHDLKYEKVQLLITNTSNRKPKKFQSFRQPALGRSLESHRFTPGVEIVHPYTIGH